MSCKFCNRSRAVNIQRAGQQLFQVSIGTKVINKVFTLGGKGNKTIYPPKKIVHHIRMQGITRALRCSKKISPATTQYGQAPPKM